MREIRFRVVQPVALQYGRNLRSHSADVKERTKEIVVFHFFHTFSSSLTRFFSLYRLVPGILRVRVSVCVCVRVCVCTMGVCSF